MKKEEIIQSLEETTKNIEMMPIEEFVKVCKSVEELHDIITDCIEDLDLYDAALQNRGLDKEQKMKILRNMMDTAEKLSKAALKLWLCEVRE